jgi:large subunit ribosomal protein L18
MSQVSGKVRRVIRHRRLRRKVSGTPDRPRLAVFRSLKNISVQAIDDSSGRTLFSASTLEASVKDQDSSQGKIDSSKNVGELLALRAKEKGIMEAVFDRGGYKYHGRIKAVAEAARSGGLKI